LAVLHQAEQRILCFHRSAQSVDRTGSQGVRGSNPLSSTLASGAPPPEFAQVRRGFLLLVSILWSAFVWLLGGPGVEQIWSTASVAAKWGHGLLQTHSAVHTGFGASPRRLEIGCWAIVAVPLGWMGGSSRGHHGGGAGMVRCLRCFSGPGAATPAADPTRMSEVRRMPPESNLDPPRAGRTSRYR
jgi:hypothetical protein